MIVSLFQWVALHLRTGAKRRARRAAEDQLMEQYKARHHLTLPNIPVTDEYDTRG
jgi:hypothetical protein